MPKFTVVREYKATAEIEAETEQEVKVKLREMSFDDFPRLEETDEFVFPIREYGTIRDL